jgi:hypothetical protein
MAFDDLLKESYLGFATGSDVDLSDLRLLYYGRKNMFIAFTDDGLLSDEATSREIDRPYGLLCHELNAVVGHRVKSSAFYMNVLRINTTPSRTLSDVRRYSNEDLLRDLNVAKLLTKMNDTEWGVYIKPILGDVTIRFPFEKLWFILHDLSIKISKDKYDRVWASLLQEIGYDMIKDPYGTGMLALGTSPVVLSLDASDRDAVDILTAQKRRFDPRRATREKVERLKKSMRNSRKRIAKR